MIDLNTLTIREARAKLDSREWTTVELVSLFLSQIKSKNGELNAYLEVFDDALSQAERADEMIRKGESRPLLGIPLAIKDNILIKGRIATSSSKILGRYVASYDATVIRKLKKEGVIFLGRTNMDEFVLGSSTENSAFGVTRNPYDLTRVPGGTSGGSAAAVASSLALGALGSDTGGSIRLPASFCGMVGMKPTYGRVSRFGLMASVSSFDVVGPIARTVEDAQMIFETVAGEDMLDSTSVPDKPDAYNFKKKPIIGIPFDLINQDGVYASVRENFQAVVDSFTKSGFEVKNIKLPNCLALYYIINFAEVSTNLSRFDGLHYGFSAQGENLGEVYTKSRGLGFGQEASRRILLGAYVLSAGYYDAYYGRAQSARIVLKGAFEGLFSKIDFVLTPTSPVPAWKIGEKSDPLSMYLADIFTVTANIAGIQAISLPSGFALVEGKQLPLWVQFMAAHGQDEALFEIGKKFEKIKKT